VSLTIDSVPGLDRGALARVAEAVEHDVEADLYDGAVLIVARAGEIGLHAAIGYADRARNRAATTEDVFRILSTTKAFTNVLTLAAIERGLFALTTCVVEIIPEYVGEERFAGVHKGEVTIQHLLTHRAAMPSRLYPVPPGPDIGVLEKTVAAVCAIDLIGVPGERVNYSPSFNHVLLGEILRRTLGEGGAYRDMMQHELLDPLEMASTRYGAPAEWGDRLVPLVPKFSTEGWMIPWDITVMNELIHEDAEMPWVGAVSTTDDVHRLADMLRRGGERGGARILSPAAIDLASRVHTGTKENDIYGGLARRMGWPVPPANMGLGFQLRGEGIYHHMLGTMASPRTFGNYGAGSSLFWIDPERDLSFVFLSAGVMEQAPNIERFQRLSDMVIAAAV
jgi:CubicO group peptidase (beta-lactamase class C family)